MIKLTVEIKDEKFIFDYVVGRVSKSSGECDLCPDTLNAFNLMVKLCHDFHKHSYREWEHECIGKGYLEKHPELIKSKVDDLSKGE